MNKCPRCKGTGKFRFGGMDSICRCPSHAAEIKEMWLEGKKDLDVEISETKKKRKRREGAGAAD